MPSAAQNREGNMRAHDNPNFDYSGRSMCAVLLSVAVCGQAQTVDLIDHNGFEACWSQVIPKPAFLFQLYSSIEGTTGCITARHGNPAICEMATCAANVAGCPITLHAGVFSGDFVTGSFDGPGSVDNFSTQVTLNGLTCLATVSNMTLAYAPTYSLQVDGNNGAYTAALNAPVQVSVDRTRIAISGGAACDASGNTYADFVLQELGTAASNTVVVALQPATVGESICPLSP
jgi:hypothetical protein